MSLCELHTGPGAKRDYAGEHGLGECDYRTKKSVLEFRQHEVDMLPDCRAPISRNPICLDFNKV